MHRFYKSSVYLQSLVLNRCSINAFGINVKSSLHSENLSEENNPEILKGKIYRQRDVLFITKTIEIAVRKY